jgi:rare lipoprotein A (peptidoglycan hydrolase)
VSQRRNNPPHRPAGSVRSEQSQTQFPAEYYRYWCDNLDFAPEFLWSEPKKYCASVPQKYPAEKEEVHAVGRQAADRRSPALALDAIQSGAWVASWYGPGFHGRKMANGKRYNMYDPTVVANPWLPLGTRIEVTNLKNNKSTVVVVQDRGPYVDWDPDRVLDLSKQAAADLGLKPGTKKDEGLATVSIRVLSLPEGS